MLLSMARTLLFMHSHTWTTLLCTHGHTDLQYEEGRVGLGWAHRPGGGQERLR